MTWYTESYRNLTLVAFGRCLVYQVIQIIPYKESRGSNATNLTTLAAFDVFELQRVICQKLPILTYPTCIWHLRWGDPGLSFAEILGIRKLESLGYHVALFA